MSLQGTRLSEGNPFACQSRWYSKGSLVGEYDTARIMDASVNDWGVLL